MFGELFGGILVKLFGKLFGESFGTDSFTRCKVLHSAEGITDLFPCNKFLLHPLACTKVLHGN